MEHTLAIHKDTIIFQLNSTGELLYSAWKSILMKHRIYSLILSMIDYSKTNLTGTGKQFLNWTGELNLK